MMPAKTKKELRAEKKALRRAAHLRAMQDHEREESGEENYRRTADPPAYVATNEGDIVAAPKSPPRRAEKRGPGADGGGEVAEQKKKPQIRGILKKPTLPMADFMTDKQASGTTMQPMAENAPVSTVDLLPAEGITSSLLNRNPS